MTELRPITGPDDHRLDELKGLPLVTDPEGLDAFAGDESVEAPVRRLRWAPLRCWPTLARRTSLMRHNPFQRDRSTNQPPSKAISAMRRYLLVNGT